MKTYAFYFALIIIGVASFSSADENKGGESCHSCHSRETPGIITHWTGSAHAREGIGCGECHGGDYSEIHEAEDKRRAVEAYICAKCHADASREHFSGKHGIGLRAGRACTREQEMTPEIKAGCTDCHEKGSSQVSHKMECARFLAQTPEMRRQGCLACHKVENRCDTCHTSHGTDLDAARDPAMCGRCHMGPDHPQYEMWKLSMHGIIHAKKGNDFAPDCAACHMSGGSHNVSKGITMGLAGQRYPDETRNSERNFMLSICSRCHAESFAAENLNDGDMIQRQSKKLLDEASSIINELDKEGLLMPSPSERPAHPLSGNTLVTGPQMLYEDLSRVEALYFKMKKFYYIITYKGVFHQNPDYAHWYGNAPLKLTLSEIRSEAGLLRELKLLKERVDNLSALGIDNQENNGPETQLERLKRELRQLRERYLRKKLSEDEYRERKNRLMERYGL